MAPDTITVAVRVMVLSTDDPERVAREMVADALASRAPRWQLVTFVSEGDVSVVTDEVQP